MKKEVLHFIPKTNLRTVGKGIGFLKPEKMQEKRTGKIFALICGKLEK